MFHEASAGEEMIVDLSHRLEPGMPSYPGLPVPKFHIFLAHGDSAQHAHYASGTSFQIASYELGGNTGTYVDAPFHCHPHGADLAGMPLEKLAHLAGVVMSAPEDGPIEAGVVFGVSVRDKAVLVHTGWAKPWGSTNYFRSGPYLTAGACEHLVHQGAALVGIDGANIDNMKRPRATRAYPAAGGRYSDRRASERAGSPAGPKFYFLCGASGHSGRYVVPGARLRAVRVKPTPVRGGGCPSRAHDCHR